MPGLKSKCSLPPPSDWEPPSFPRTPRADGRAPGAEAEPMKIVLVGNYPADNQPSMLRYAAFMERELQRAGHQVRVIFPRVFARKFAPGAGLLGKWLGYVDKYLFFRIGFSGRIRDAELVHICDHSSSMYLPWVKTAPRMITCHDALAIRSALGHYPENRTGVTGRILQEWIRRSMRHADRIIYVSDKTRFDFEQLLGVGVPYEVIFHALNWRYSAATEAQVAATLGRLGLERNGYILHVGGNQWYKNRTGVLKMFIELRKHDRYRFLRLVMVGKPHTSEMRELCRANGLTDVLELTHVDNEQLRILYSGAFALLFPSFEEGFGWPVLEAQACGCPVITSNRAPMTEIARDSAKFVDPASPESIIQAVRSCAEDKDELVAAGFRNLARFAVEAVIRQYERAYQALLTSSGETRKHL